MGRKKIKKNFANKTINEKITNSNENDTMKNFGKVLVGVLVVFVMVFLVLNTFMDDPKKDDAVVDYTDNLGYNKILAQDTFNKKDSDYVVFFINGEEGKDEVNAYFQALEGGSALPKIYVVDMAESVNAKYLVDDTEEVDKYGTYATVEYDKEPASINELQIYEFPTVIRVSNGNFQAYYEGDEFYEPLGITNPNASQTQQGYQ